ncbi:MAG: heme ABC transporter permease CcmC [Gammaproteobacteria bacterium]|nr:heme ABC transporter permease CcmC [Gammaproteobacteria bacterium]MDE0094331.1 heme ABC transporter permease CcmC [Gammaproteobacteria bacterium]MDE0251677.1 heme ABC transporter permease CcmC [Gammaproteobacteria bacterium]MDE0403313.1 heme ABC transporter permease CcmC [Gammaproteobacteria bacterium]
MRFVPTFLRRLSTPQHFFHDTQFWAVVLCALGLLGLCVGSVWGLCFVPPERYQGDSFRILFVHAPSAHIAQMIYLAIAVAGFVQLVWKLKLADTFIRAAAPIGCTLTLFALISGMLWGMPTWGTAWVWDARTTSMLVLFFLYFGLIVIRQVFTNPERAAKAISVIAIVGAINIPIIKFSVEWFETLHQPASLAIGKPSAIATVFLIPLLINFVAISVFSAGVILASMRSYVLIDAVRTTWVREQLNKNKRR